MRVGYFTMPLHPPGADPGGTMAVAGDACLLVDEVIPRL
jgi:hypothetical protein